GAPGRRRPTCGILAACWAPPASGERTSANARLIVTILRTGLMLENATARVGTARRPGARFCTGRGAEAAAQANAPGGPKSLAELRARPLRSCTEIYATVGPRDTDHGPVQSNGMCLLEFVVHWNL